MWRKSMNSVQLWRMGAIPDTQVRVIGDRQWTGQYGLVFEPHYKVTDQAQLGRFSFSSVFQGRFAQVVAPRDEWQSLSRFPQWNPPGH